MSNTQKIKISRTVLLKDIRQLLYSFGDSCSPRTDTAEVVLDYLLNYLSKILNETKLIGKIKGKVKTEDLLYVIRHDKRKLRRVKQMLKTNERLNKARKTFEMDEFEK